MNHTGPILGIIFSKDRAMLLDGTLRSFFRKCIDSDNVVLHVLYIGSSDKFLGQYSILEHEFPNVRFICQNDFYQNVIELIGDNTNPLVSFLQKIKFSYVNTFQYVLFLVDDNIFIKDFYLGDVVNALDKEKDALGFSLQIGTNLNYCYPLDINIRFPSYTAINDEVIKYCWPDAGEGLNYPLEISSSIYRWKEIYRLIAGLTFTNPNTLESEMASKAVNFLSSHPFLLCHKQSVTFCNPINKVQSEYNNKSGDRPEYSSVSLAQLFDEGFRIDIDVYDDFVPNACHQLVDIALVKRPPKGQHVGESEARSTRHALHAGKTCRGSSQRT